MCPLRPSISKAWRCILSSRRFPGGISSGADPRLKEDSYRYNCGFKSVGDHNRGYGTGNGKFRSNDESDDVRAGSNSRGNATPGHKNFSSGKFGRNHRSQTQSDGIGGCKPTTRCTRVRGRRGGFEDGFRMPDFDPGSDQLKKIFESQMNSSGPIDGLDLEEAGPIEGNFRDDDDSEAEDFYRNA